MVGMVTQGEEQEVVQSPSATNLQYEKNNLCSAPERDSIEREVNVMLCGKYIYLRLRFFCYLYKIPKIEIIQLISLKTFKFAEDTSVPDTALKDVTNMETGVIVEIFKQGKN